MSWRENTHASHFHLTNFVPVVNKHAVVAAAIETYAEEESAPAIVIPWYLRERKNKQCRISTQCTEPRSIRVLRKERGMALTFVCFTTPYTGTANSTSKLQTSLLRLTPAECQVPIFGISLNKC